MTIYSTSLFLGTLNVAEGTKQLFEVPPGTTVVIRDLDISTYETLLPTLEFWIGCLDYYSTLRYPIRFQATSEVEGEIYYQWQGRFVVPVTEDGPQYIYGVRQDAGGPDAELQVSGYVLTP